MSPFTDTPALLGGLLGGAENLLRFAVESIVFWSQSVVNSGVLKLQWVLASRRRKRRMGSGSQKFKLLIHRSSSRWLRSSDADYIIKS